MSRRMIEDVRGAFPGGHFPGDRPIPPSLSSAAAATPPADGVDRISALPDALLRDVVSRLPVRDAARTAALASRWRGVWRATPLVLRDDDLLLASDGERAPPEALVGRILADHPGPFRSVHVSHCSLATGGRELGDWARHLAAKGVQDLVFLDNPPMSPWMRFPLPADILRCLPADILRCASLHRLFLGTCTFPDTTGAPRGPDAFPHLKEFSMLSGNMSEHDLDHMLACSPKLETLALIISRMTKRILLRGESLKCMLLWVGVADELAVVDAPHLERLVLWQTVGHSGPIMTVKIDAAPELRVLGRLDPRLHQLQIGNTIINAQTKASPSCTVPSVKILALELNFCISKNVNMLTSFLRCFPNVETLHIKSSRDGVATGGHPAKYWQEVGPIKCVKSHVNKIIIHEFQGEQCEWEFLKFIAKRARKLQAMVLVLSIEKFTSARAVHEVNCQLRALATVSWAAEECNVLLVGPKLYDQWCFAKASDLSVQDPFW